MPETQEVGPDPYPGMKDYGAVVTLMINSLPISGLAAGMDGAYNKGEVWRPLTAYPGYWASTLGRIWSCRRHGTPGRILKMVPVESNRHKRYLKVRVSQGPGGYRWVHQLIAEAFLGPRPEGQEVMHLDDDGFDNRLGNLRYGTKAENMAMRRDRGWRMGKCGHTEDRTDEYMQCMECGERWWPV